MTSCALVYGWALGMTSGRVVAWLVVGQCGAAIQLYPPRLPFRHDGLFVAPLLRLSSEKDGLLRRPHGVPASRKDDKRVRHRPRQQGAIYWGSALVQWGGRDLGSRVFLIAPDSQ